MEKFTASNGIVFTFPEDGSFRWEAGHPPAQVSQALREVVLHERDQELGRWRWPGDSNVVVVPKDREDEDGHRWVAVYDERRMGEASWFCSDWSDPGTRGRQPLHDAAHDYFAAHPEPKPWHDAKHGEIWVLQIKDCHAPEPYRFAQDTMCADSCVFRPVSNPKRVFFDPRSPLIVDAHRIYPEVSDD